MANDDVEYTTEPVTAKSVINEDKHSNDYTSMSSATEPTDEMQQAFEEIASSSLRIAGSLNRLNSIAADTYNELSATRRALAVKEAA